jgi:hypothetical protein
MPTSNSNLPSNQGNSLSSPKPVAEKIFLSKSNIPMKFSQHNKRTTVEQTKPQSFTTKKRQEPDEEMGTLRMKDEKKTKVVRSILNSPVAVNQSDCSNHQRQAAQKQRGKYSLAKNQGSDGGRVSSVKERKDRNIIRKPRMISFVRVKPSGISLLLMLSILSVVQALSDCQIMHKWLPEMFDGSRIACCEQSGISCSGGRITGLYAS